MKILSDKKYYAIVANACLANKPEPFDVINYDKLLNASNASIDFSNPEFIFVSIGRYNVGTANEKTTILYYLTKSLKVEMLQNITTFNGYSGYSGSGTTTVKQTVLPNVIQFNLCCSRAQHNELVKQFNAAVAAKKK